MECQKCGKVVPDGVKFCPGCGARLDAVSTSAPAADETCPACGAPHAPGVKFCKHCGASFQGAASASAPPGPASPTAVSMNPDVPAAHAGSEASVVSQDATVDATAAYHRERAMAPPEPTPSEAPAEPVAAPSAQPVAEKSAPTPEPENLVTPAAPASIDGSPARGARKGWLIGVLAAVIVIVLAGAAFAYFKFAKPAHDTEAANGAPASALSSTAAMPVAPVSAASTAVASATSSPTTSAVATPAPTERAPAATMPAETLAPSAATSVAAAPPVDHTLQMASDLVHKGERAYTRGDYQTAIRHAHSALDVHPGYVDAERLLRRAQAAQRRIAEQQQEEARREAAAQAERARAAATAQAAQTPPAPTPDQIYNRRAHDECARGFFGKACRHKIRQEVCVGVSLTAPGTSVCRDLKD
jgi:Double zinc ribbon